ncbi:MAG: nucleotidyltransferase family protein [bacterium]|nr:nucleotidyltransferase family protein [bacterium]
MTVNKHNLRQLIGRALGISNPNPQLWGLISRNYGGITGLIKILNVEKIIFLALPGLKLCEDIPDSVIHEIEKLKSANRARNLYLLKIYEEISSRFDNEGIVSLPIKGVDLISDFYADPALRPISDIDLLVKPTHFTAAIESLREMGFDIVRAGQRLPGVWAAVNLFRGDDVKPVWVDLHYCPGPAVGKRIEKTIELFKYVNVKESLPPEYRLIILAAHHQNHFMSMPIIAYYELIRLLQMSDYDELNDLIRGWEVADAADYALKQAAWIFGFHTHPIIDVKTDVLCYLTANKLRGRGGGFTGLESLIYLLSLDNPGVGVPFGLELLYKKIESRR